MHAQKFENELAPPTLQTFGKCVQRVKGMVAFTLSNILHFSKTNLLCLYHHVVHYRTKCNVNFILRKEWCYIKLRICDAIWENLSDVAKHHFEKWLKIVPILPHMMSQLLQII